MWFTHLVYTYTVNPLFLKLFTLKRLSRKTENSVLKDQVEEVGPSMLVRWRCFNHTSRANTIYASFSFSVKKFYRCHRIRDYVKKCYGRPDKSLYVLQHNLYLHSQMLLYSLNRCLSCISGQHMENKAMQLIPAIP